MNISMRCVVLVALVASSAVAQSTGEAEFFSKAVKKLNSYATRCMKGGYPSRGKELWLELLKEYDTNDAVARKALGYTQVGASWAPDSRFTYPTKDTPDAGVARILKGQWKGIAKELGAGHRKVAEACAAAGKVERATYHYDRALRFLPADKVAAKARGQKSFEGLSGNELEITLLRRSRLMDREVARLLTKTYKVKKVAAGTKNPLLEKGGVPVIGVESDNFIVWGEWSETVLIGAAMNAERSLEFCKKVFAGYPEYRWRKKGKLQYAFYNGKETWGEVLRANEGSVNGKLKFVLENTSATSMGAGQNEVRIAGFGHKGTVDDYAVRIVAQVYAGLSADALNEGIGHAVVGKFFGRNLIFSVAQEDSRDRGTNTGLKQRRAKFKMPDLAIWEELAVDLAWEGTSTVAGKLPLLKSSNFPSEARIKAWSFLDYLLRRDPSYIRLLDRARGSNVQDVNGRFDKKTKGEPTLVSLDHDWREFWTNDTPVLNAIKGKKTPLESVSKNAPQYIEAFNKQRAAQKAFKLSSVGWSSDYSVACQDHADYLKANKSERGIQKEATQAQKKKGYSNSGRSFAERALICTKAKNADDVMEDWMLWPGYRDAILNPNLAKIGVYVGSSILVIDPNRGLDFEGKAQGRSIAWPANGQKAVPTEVSVKEIGPELVAALKARGKKKIKVVGIPLTFHTFSSQAMPKASSFKCSVKLRGKVEVEGFVHIADNGKIRRSAAPGLAVFYPYQPLKNGSVYQVEWSYTSNDGQPNDVKFSFTTK